jgi:hypothetical protein
LQRSSIGVSAGCGDAGIAVKHLVEQVAHVGRSLGRDEPLRRRWR